MALSNVALVSQAGFAPGDPVYVDTVTLDLDASYPAAGYDLSEGSAERLLLDAQIGKGRTILAVVAQTNNPGTTKVKAVFDQATDKLIMFDMAGGVISGGVNLASVVGLELVLLSK